MKEITGWGIDYDDCLRAAGATVHDWKSFGSYQGEWWAHVTLADGRTGFVQGAYGSCPWCDGLSALGIDRKLVQKDDGSTVTLVSDDEWERLADFGRGELEYFHPTLESALREAEKHISWDLDAKAAVEWLKGRESWVAE